MRGEHASVPLAVALQKAVFGILNPSDNFASSHRGYIKTDVKAKTCKMSNAISQNCSSEKVFQTLKELTLILLAHVEYGLLDSGAFALGCNHKFNELILWATYDGYESQKIESPKPYPLARALN